MDRAPSARPRGRPAAASREDVVGAAMERYLRGDVERLREVEAALPGVS